MTYALKLLFYALLVALPAAWLMRPAFKGLVTEAEYKRAWQTLLWATVAAFLSRTPGLLMVTVGLVGLVAAPRLAKGAPGALAVFALLLPTLPPISASIGGIGDINQLLTLNPTRILSLVVLLPVAWRLMSATTVRGAVRPPNWVGFDLAVLAYPLLKIALAMPYSTTTTSLRQLVEVFTDTWLPFYVFTRGLRTKEDIRFVLTHLALGLAFVAAVALAESIANKQLYQGLEYIYEFRWQLTTTLMRGDRLRVQATMPQPIALAFAMIFALGTWAWLRGRDWRQLPVKLMFLLFGWALVATWSRGPWLGAVMMALSLLALRHMSGRAFGVLLLGLVATGAAVKVSGADDVVINALKAIFGGSEADFSTIEYRRELLDTALALVQQSPWWGVPNYAVYMEHLRQGEGIIDLVNSYIAVALDAGVIGVSLFVLPYVWVMARLLSAIVPSKANSGSTPLSSEAVFVALLAAVMLTIFTTSITGVMPYLMLVFVAVPLTWLSTEAADRAAAETQAGGGFGGPVCPQPWRAR